MTYIISGIQQVGIGNANVHETFKWYRQHFGIDTPIFEEAAEANLMLPYTGGKPHQRHAILAISLNGGAGLEIWQYTSRKPEACAFEIQLGDLGFNCTKIKSRDIRFTHQFLKKKHAPALSAILTTPNGAEHFFLKDLNGNLLQVVKGEDWFGKSSFYTGGPCGVIIGVSNLERSMKFYKDILGFDTVIYDKTGQFEDFKDLPGGEHRFRRVLLKHSKAREGSFSKLLGSGLIELIQVMDRSPRKIFENRFWGDIGFIHLCFDIKNMKALKARCQETGHPFTVESNPDFDMGEAAGQFAYIEDPDGALIEFVETHKIPILKKAGWYLDLRKRDPRKKLPDWMLKALKLNRVKDRK